MSFSVNSYDDDFFCDAETYSVSSSDSGREHGGVAEDEACMDSVPLDTGNKISFNPTVEAKGLNGSISHFPIAAYDGFHNCRQYFSDPCPSSLAMMGSGDGNNDSSDPSLSLNGALEAEEGSMSWNSGNLDASPQLRNGGAGMEGPVLMAGMTKMVHYVTGLFEDDDLEEDRSSSSASEKEGEEQQREMPRREESNPENRNGNKPKKKGGCQTHQSAAEKARAAK